MKKILGILIVFIALFTFNLNVNAANDKIDISEVKVIDKSSTIAVDDPTIENNAINSSVKFNKVDDFVIYEVSLKNADKYDYTIDKVLDNNTSDYLSVEYEYSDELKKNNSGTLKIKLTYKKQVLNQDKVSLDDIVITMNLIRSDGSKSSIKITNPTTGDSIVRYVIIFILAISGLILTIKKVKFKNIKVGMFVLVLPLVMLPFSIFAFEKFNIKITFTDIELTGEYEVYDIQIGDTTRKVTYGEEIGQLPEIPEKNGYEVDGWVDSDGNEITEDTIVTKPLTLTPKYTAKNYPITFNLGTDGTTTNDNTYTIEDEVVLTEPTREGYTFLGWTGFNGNTPQKSVTIPKGTTGPIELTANWKNDTEYTVTFNPGEGQVTQESIKVESGETINSFPTPDREGYDFLGWYSGDTKVEAPYIPTSDIELLAHYEESKLVKYFDSNDDKEISAGDLVKIGNDEFLVIGYDGPNVHLLSKYNLSENSRQVSGDEYYYSYFTSTKYWLSENCVLPASASEPVCEDIINPDNYPLENENEKHYYVYRSEIENPLSDSYDNSVEYFSENYIYPFVNNYKQHLIDDLGADFIVDARIPSLSELFDMGCNVYSASCPTGNQSFWTGTVDFDDSEEIYYIYQGHVYTSNSMYYSSGIRPVITIPANLLGSWDVKFDAQDGTDIIVKNVASGEPIGELPGIAPKEKHVFKGWGIRMYGTIYDLITPDTRVYGEITYYPKWLELFTLAFDPQNGEEIIETKNIEYGTSLSSGSNSNMPVPPDPSKEGYVFAGWYSEISGGTKLPSYIYMNSDLTYYARWGKIYSENNITYTDIDGDKTISIGDSVKIGNNDEFYVLAPPSDGKIKLSAKYNLNSSSRQSTNYLRIIYADSNYWENNLSNYPEESPTYNGQEHNYYIYRTKSGSDTQNNVYPYINNYKSYLVNDLDVEVYDARILSYTDAIGAGCSSTWSNTCPKFLTNQTYWLGSVTGLNHLGIWKMSTCYSGLTDSQRFDMTSDDRCPVGVRPVVIVPESMITDLLD